MRAHDTSASPNGRCQLFYVLTILLGVLGAAVPFRVIAAASLVAATGMAAPHITDGSWTIGLAVGAGLLPPLFWLILDQFARFMLRLHRPTSLERDPRDPPVRVRTSAYPEPARAVSGDEARPSDTHADDVTVFDWAQFARDTLTSRQHEVVLLVAEGLRNVEIARCLGISATQVGRHLHNARRETAWVPQLVLRTAARKVRFCRRNVVFRRVEACI